MTRLVDMFEVSAQSVRPSAFVCAMFVYVSVCTTAVYENVRSLSSGMVLMRISLKSVCCLSVSIRASISLP